MLRPANTAAEAAAAAALPGAARRDAAARLACNGPAVVRFAGCGRGCGRGPKAAEAAARSFRGTAVDAALRWVVSALLGQQGAEDLEASARRQARHLSGDAELLPALRFLAQNVAAPRDMAPASAVALRRPLRLLLAVLSGPVRGLTRPRKGRHVPSAAWPGDRVGRPTMAARDAEGPQRVGGGWRPAAHGGGT